MYYTVNGNKEMDYGYGKEGNYRKEVRNGTFNPMFKKAVKKRNDKVGKKCTECFTIKSLTGECINCD
jgi:hypothetical protein